MSDKYGRSKVGPRIYSKNAIFSFFSCKFYYIMKILNLENIHIADKEGKAISNFL